MKRCYCLFIAIGLAHCILGKFVDPNPIDILNDYYYDDSPLTVCYEEIGCFSSTYPFYDPPYRPVSWLPESRAEVGTHFYLNTRQNPQSPTELITSDTSTIRNSFFNPSLATKIIVHGFTQNADVQWMYDMQEAFLNYGEFNVIRVDWRQGAVDLYGKAVANTRIVGAEISLIIDRIKEVFGMTSSQSFHIIGHSLGGHVAGYAGERQADLGRITGMDPAGPYYEETDTIVRLDPTDALFVDVIHTDTSPIYNLGMGIYVPCGHVDIYANGGQEQPGCDQGIVEHIITEGSLVIGGVSFVACNHLRSYELFTESINTQCPFTAMRCDGYTYEEYLAGKCFDQSQTIALGYHADRNAISSAEENAIFYMRTTDETPFCGESYWLKLYLVNKFIHDDVKGQLFVTLFGTLGQTTQLPLNLESIIFQHDKNYKFAFLAEDDIGDLTGLYFEWEYDRDWYRPWEWDFFIKPQIYIDYIEVEYAEDDFRYLLCSGSGSNRDGIEADGEQAAFLVSSQCS
ncbi:pancreatic triacylglycerol lipase-like [Lytechinus pictus]|uniref:pancreatic triacylglycerol lipase-like n=1 Tax=Lytechinus pictus TaxID=7653 RepID=UPI0030B9FE1E